MRFVEGICVSRFYKKDQNLPSNFLLKVAIAGSPEVFFWSFEAIAGSLYQMFVIQFYV